MGIASISGASQIVATTADNPGHAVATAAGASAALRPSSPTPEAASPRDDVTQQPKPPRFPWLSRLSQELEPVARKKPAFPSAPALGETLDRSA